MRPLSAGGTLGQLFILQHQATIIFPPNSCRQLGSDILTRRDVDIVAIIDTGIGKVDVEGGW